MDKKSKIYTSQSSADKDFLLKQNMGALKDNTLSLAEKLYPGSAYSQALKNTIKTPEKPVSMKRESFLNPNLQLAHEQNITEDTHPQKPSFLSRASKTINDIAGYASSPAGKQIIGALYSKLKSGGKDPYAGLDFANALNQQAEKEQGILSAEASSKNAYETALMGKLQDQSLTGLQSEAQRQHELELEQLKEKAAMSTKEADIAAQKSLKEMEIGAKPIPKTAAEEAESAALKAAAEAKARMGVEQEAQSGRITQAKPEIEATAGRIAGIGGKAEKGLSSLGYAAQKGLSKFPFVGKYLKPKDLKKEAVDQVKSELGVLEGIIPEYEYRNMVKSLNADDVELSDIKAIFNKIRLYGAAK